ncbi:MAG TPA: ABC transporter substrate-binding protein [Candidatus Acidoferrum sp.]|jgi:putative spermidine/putrescine transport system substrate-binding protein/spermidine/putrescine transport system substrate-binding protein|nr:ABC transporter substrate-binding protein [Candidatus Acidoferrum sp.]
MPNNFRTISRLRGANFSIIGRDPIAAACGVALLLVVMLGCGACKPKQPTLTLLVWEGYADPSFLGAFEESHHCKVVASYMGTSDELVAKLRGGSASNYDVISPSSDVAASIVRAGLAAPLDVSKIPAYSQLSTKLRDSNIVKLNGQVYGVPFVWGPNPLLYDTTAFAKAPDSWGILWDAKYRGRVSVWDELSTIYMAAQVLGYDKPDPSQLYNLSDAQLEAVKKKLIELKPNIRKMWATGGELTNLFQNHEVVIAMGWPLMTNELRKLNFPIGETIPGENTTGWIDHLMITAASSNKVLAQEFLAYMVEAQTQKKVSDVTHYTPANPGAAQFLTADEKKMLHLDDPDAYMQRIYFWQDVPRRSKYNEIWNEVKAAQ